MGHKQRKDVTYAFVLRTPDSPVQKIRMEKLAQMADKDPVLRDVFACDRAPKSKLVVYDDSDPAEAQFPRYPEAFALIAHPRRSAAPTPIVGLPASEFSTGTTP